MSTCWRRCGIRSETTESRSPSTSPIAGPAPHGARRVSERGDDLVPREPREPRRAAAADRPHAAPGPHRADHMAGDALARPCPEKVRRPGSGHGDQQRPRADEAERVDAVMPADRSRRRQHPVVRRSAPPQEPGQQRRRKLPGGERDIAHRRRVTRPRLRVRPPPAARRRPWARALRNRPARPMTPRAGPRPRRRAVRAAPRGRGRRAPRPRAG